MACSACAPHLPCQQPPQLGPPWSLLAAWPACCPLSVCFPFDLAGIDKVQPATEQLRYVSRHGYDGHVLRAHRACPLPAISAVRPSLGTACATAAPRPPVVRRTCCPSLACFPFDSAGRAVVQQQHIDLEHVQGHKHGPHACGALGACPRSDLRSWASLCTACATAAPRPPAAWPSACRPSSYPPLRLGSPRTSTSR